MRLYFHLIRWIKLDLRFVLFLIVMLFNIGNLYFGIFTYSCIKSNRTLINQTTDSLPAQDEHTLMHKGLTKICHDI